MLAIRSFKITYFFHLFTSMQVSVAPHSFDVAMGSVSPPLFDALEFGHALMEVMRGTAVSFSPILTVINSCSIIVISEYDTCYNLYSFLSKWSISMQQQYMHPLLSSL